MRKLIVPVALALAMAVFGTSAMAGDSVPDDDFDDFDDFDDTSGDDSSPAIPEPGAALAMGAGLAAIAFALRRRR
jgi:PEP-CTERM motif